MKVQSISVRKVMLGAMATLLTSGLSTTTLAADYPTKPIQMIVLWRWGQHRHHGADLRQVR